MGACLIIAIHSFMIKHFYDTGAYMSDRDEIASNRMGFFGDYILYLRFFFVGAWPVVLSIFLYTKAEFYFPACLISVAIGLLSGVKQGYGHLLIIEWLLFTVVGFLAFIPRIKYVSWGVQTWKSFLKPTGRLTLSQKAARLEEAQEMNRRIQQLYTDQFLNKGQLDHLEHHKQAVIQDIVKRDFDLKGDQPKTGGQRLIERLNDFLNEPNQQDN